MVVTLASTGGAAKIYCVNGSEIQGKNAAAWMDEQTKRKRSGGQGGTGGEGQIRLIQDFSFPEASNKIKITPDGQYAIATGTYKPRMKVFDLPELSLKTERVTDAENVDFCILSSDWTKTLHLQTDRTVGLHNQSSLHYQVRVPKHGRALAYHFPSCDALVGGEGNEVYRLNLETGRFMQPFGMEGAAENDGGTDGGYGGGSDVVTGVNAIDINPAHQLLMFGTETAGGAGSVEMWDPRSRARAGILRLPYARLLAESGSSLALAHALPGVDTDSTRPGIAVTALASRSDGLNIAVGTNTGHTLLYDLRQAQAYTTKDQGYGLPVKSLSWVEQNLDMAVDGGWVASADAKVVKIWAKEGGRNLVSINPPAPVNDLALYPGTGLVMLATETPEMAGYYIPKLGPAPKWARFLDNMTEEMEDGQEELLYDDYKFVDRDEIESLNLGHLIGTDVLKPYMHGFFMDLRLYTKARVIANPFAYNEYRERLVREKLEKEQESRIRAAQTPTTALPKSVKVNKKLAKKLLGAAEADEETTRKSKKLREKAQDGAALLEDDRFKDMFSNPDFEIDENSAEYKLLHPSDPKRRNVRRPDSDESEEDEEEAEEHDEVSDVSDVASEVSGNESPYKPSLVAGDSGTDSDSDDGSHATPLDTRETQTFGQRAKQSAARAKATETTRKNSTTIIRQGTGGMEMSFIPRGVSAEEKEERRQAKRAKMLKEKKKNAEFGIGLSKGSSRDSGNEATFEGDDASGRKKPRHINRSASKNAMRSMKR